MAERRCPCTGDTQQVVMRPATESLTPDEMADVRALDVLLDQVVALKHQLAERDAEIVTLRARLGAA